MEPFACSLALRPIDQNKRTSKSENSATDFGPSKSQIVVGTYRPSASSVPTDSREPRLAVGQSTNDCRRDPRSEIRSDHKRLAPNPESSAHSYERDCDTPQHSPDTNKEPTRAPRCDED